jgi:hypothetical protein
MNRLAFLPTVLCIAGLTTVAWAQEPIPPATDVPPARVGFQMALRAGYALPMGRLTDAPNADMTNVFSGQVPLFVEIGGKPSAHLFVGGYFGLGFGGPAGVQKDQCDTLNANCVAVGIRLGAELQYHILPEGSANPWLGYGIGYESIALSGSSGGRTQTVSVGGFEYAHFMGGIDFRLNHGFGIGPVVDFSIGEYSHAHYDSGTTTTDEDIQKKATHEWLTLGVRFVFFP